jgi:hypothetical protein
MSQREELFLPVEPVISLKFIVPCVDFFFVKPYIFILVIDWYQIRIRTFSVPAEEGIQL